MRRDIGIGSGRKNKESHQPTYARNQLVPTRFIDDSLPQSVRVINPDAGWATLVFLNSTRGQLAVRSRCGYSTVCVHSEGAIRDLARIYAISQSIFQTDDLLCHVLPDSRITEGVLRLPRFSFNAMMSQRQARHPGRDPFCIPRFEPWHRG